MDNTSSSFSLNSIDWKKIGKGAFIACGGALLTYLSSILININFGQFTPIVMAGWSIIVNIIQHWIKDNS